MTLVPSMSASTFFPLQHRVEAFSSAHLQKRMQVKAKRGRGKVVTWPPEDQICQIRLFLINDVPSSIGYVQNGLQLNHLRSTTSSGLGSAHAPPGFHGCIVKRARIMDDIEASMTVGRPWHHPQKFVFGSEWLVADGDESKEAGLQQQRELRVLEAFYPRLTSIPDSPVEAVETCIAIHDSLVASIPLVPIEEEDDESIQESEHELHRMDVSSEHGKLSKDWSPNLAASAQEPRWHARDSSDGIVDVKVAAAAVAEMAACVALHKHAASGLVDPDLLVEILGNPTLLKSLTFFNQPSESPAAVMNGHDLSTAGQSSLNHQHILQCDGHPNKAYTGVSLNAGLPSPVSVLQEWTQENAKFLPSMQSKSSENDNTPSLPIVSCALPSSSAPKRLHNLYSIREDVLRLESAPVHGLHALSHEARVRNNPSCMPNSSSQPESYVDRSCGILVPPHNDVHFQPGRIQPVQSLPSQAGVMRPQGMPSLDSTLCKSLFQDTRLRGNESSGLCSMVKAGQRTKRLCMYFNTPRGCRNGGNCLFLHESGSPSEVNAIAQ